MNPTQEEINEEIYTILKCLIHSDDHYNRGVVDLNANAFLKRLEKMLHPPQDETIKRVK